MPGPSAQPPELIHLLPAHWAARTPDGEALACGDRRWTWRQLAERADRLRGALHTLGVRRGDRVAYLGRNDPACVETFLAAAGAGVATAVLNWRLAPGELAYVVADSGATVLLADAGRAAAARTALAGLTDPPLLVVTGGADDAYEPLLARSAPVPPAADVTPDDTCLVLYTSGTTGFPKGAELTHRSMLSGGTALRTVAPMEPADRNLVVLPLFHVGGIGYGLRGLVAGAPTVLLREPTPEAICRAVADGATQTLLVPAMLPGVLRADAASTAAFARLRYCLYGASPMPLPLLREALDRFPEVRFVQLYGMTELSGAVTALDHATHRDPRQAHRLASAGRPLPGVETRVADPATGAAVPLGRTGELWARTRQRMKGYLGRPDATAETVTADGWLRTGDVVRADADGFVFVEDRLKDLIISGGENIYSAEVERVLAEHPAVAEVAVIGVPDEKWGESVLAVVAARNGTRIEEAGLDAFCRRHLAGYKCPRGVAVVTALPRNASGKVDKSALRAAHGVRIPRQLPRQR
ncbi:long-chain-fatty-acid--CoA ligase [Streptomyces sp. AV19]|uniref:long-chain-fatty-acid--CoA ligase n=1 Tax=Streptomyces sp. AV19 TaxID=2793068 RepID=UPI0018FEB4BA|nr:long-chain-fatty-acid--CoA ligase [Streptomyces sp. AV19]MBH1937463.1 long-chain-fatty-acid--CoA ligase [Streptomyces sp. AV19]MDG4533764.1 long-chain-fatty-acid--CoA ligase [Streptomyces sp. AV19]